MDADADLMRRVAGGDTEAFRALVERNEKAAYNFFLRLTGISEDAEDLTQGFFARFLKRNYLEGLSSEKGRFRAFLLAALKHFLANEHDRAGRQKRGGGTMPLSFDWQDADAR